jgi:hypothetical protein
MAASDGGEAPARYDVIVVGAGIMGSSAARACWCWSASASSTTSARRTASRAASATPTRRHDTFLWCAWRGACGRTRRPRTAAACSRPRRTSTWARGTSPCSTPPSETAVVGEGAAAWPGAGAFRVPDGWMAAVSGLGGVIRASKAVEMFQRLAVKNGAVVREKTEVVDVTKQGELAIIFGSSIKIYANSFFLLECKKNIWTSDFVVDASSHVPGDGSILIKTSSGEAFHCVHRNRRRMDEQAGEVQGRSARCGHLCCAVF